MGRSGNWTTAAVLVLLSALPVTPANAAGFIPIRLAENEQAESLSADRAAEIARAATGGRVLSVDRRGNGRPWFRVKILIDGERVRYVAVDAVTGRIRE